MLCKELDIDPPSFDQMKSYNAAFIPPDFNRGMGQIRIDMLDPYKEKNDALHRLHGQVNDYMEETSQGDEKAARIKNLMQKIQAERERKRIKREQEAGYL